MEIEPRKCHLHGVRVSYRARHHQVPEGLPIPNVEFDINIITEWDADPGNKGASGCSHACSHVNTTCCNHEGRSLNGCGAEVILGGERVEPGTPVWSLMQGIAEADVQVVGLRVDCGDYQAGFTQLCEYARKAFASQPHRLFLHGFYICGPELELWVFDRSGFYGTEAYNIQDDPERLVTVTTAYTKMSNTELGHNPFVHSDGPRKYVLMPAEDDAKTLQRFYLRGDPIVFPKQLINPGPLCYHSSTKDHGSTTEKEVVVKFSWRRPDRCSEVKMMRLAREQKVQGVVQLVSHQHVDSTSDIHQRLQLVDDDTSIPNLALSCIVTSPVGHSLHHLDNISISKFPMLQFLEGFRDAIKAHRSLLFDGKILHRDISPGNIIISKSNNEGEPRGRLIDLDIAMVLTDLQRRSSNGTMSFMAIGVLDHRPHTYRHDLESFLYVFLWMAICHGKKLPPESRLQRWESEDRDGWDGLVTKKTEDMADENFSTIITEFTPEFNGLASLAYRLREILFFPLHDGSLFTGTRTEVEAEHLYDKMIGAFDVAIDSILG
ncbi:hypothetical protein ACJZ2D_004001 [Fusarium nematophilum]